MKEAWKALSLVPGTSSAAGMSVLDGSLGQLTPRWPFVGGEGAFLRGLGA